MDYQVTDLWWSKTMPPSPRWRSTARQSQFLHYIPINQLRYSPTTAPLLSPPPITSLANRSITSQHVKQTVTIAERGITNFPYFMHTKKYEQTSSMLSPTPNRTTITLRYPALSEPITESEIVDWPFETTPHPGITDFVKNLYTAMQITKFGAFTIGLTKFMEMLASKDSGDSKPVLLALEESANTLVADYKLPSDYDMFQVNIAVIVNRINLLPFDLMQKMSGVAYYILNSKYSLACEHVNICLEKYDAMFLENDTVALFGSLEEFDKYPDGGLRNTEVSKLLMDASITPYLRINDSDVRRMFLDCINEGIHFFTPIDDFWPEGDDTLTPASNTYRITLSSHPLVPRAVITEPTTSMAGRPNYVTAEPSPMTPQTSTKQLRRHMRHKFKNRLRQFLTKNRDMIKLLNKEQEYNKRRKHHHLHYNDLLQDNRRRYNQNDKRRPHDQHEEQDLHNHHDSHDPHDHYSHENYEKHNSPDEHDTFNPHDEPNLKDAYNQYGQSNKQQKFFKMGNQSSVARVEEEKDKTSDSKAYFRGIKRKHIPVKKTKAVRNSAKTSPTPNIFETIVMTFDNKPLIDEMEKSLSQVNDLLANIEGKIESDRRRQIDMDYDMLYPDAETDFMDYQVTNIWWSTKKSSPPPQTTPTSTLSQTISIPEMAFRYQPTVQLTPSMASIPVLRAISSTSSTKDWDRARDRARETAMQKIMAHWANTIRSVPVILRYGNFTPTSSMIPTTKSSNTVVTTTTTTELVTEPFTETGIPQNRYLNWPFKNTPHPGNTKFVLDLVKELHKSKYGYFTVGMAKLLEMIAIRDPSNTTPVLRAIQDVSTKPHKYNKPNQYHHDDLHHNDHLHTHYDENDRQHPHDQHDEQDLHNRYDSHEPHDHHDEHYSLDQSDEHEREDSYEQYDNVQRNQQKKFFKRTSKQSLVTRVEDKDSTSDSRANFREIRRKHKSVQKTKLVPKPAETMPTPNIFETIAANFNSKPLLIDQLQKSLTQVNEMLADIEHKIENEKKQISKLDYDLHYNDMATGFMDYQVTDMWYSTRKAPSEPNLNILRSQAQTILPTILMRYQPTPPPVTASTRDKNTDLSQGTPSLSLLDSGDTQFVTDLVKIMHHKRYGYFTVAWTKFLEMLGNGDPNNITPVLKAMKNTTAKILAEHKSSAFSQTLRSNMKILANALNSEPIENLQDMAIGAHFKMEDKDNRATPQVLNCVDTIDAIFLQHEGITLLGSLEEFHNYPDGGQKASEVSNDILKAALAPFFRRNNSNDRATLMSCVDAGVEVLNHPLRESKRAGYNIKTKDINTLMNIKQRRLPGGLAKKFEAEIKTENKRTLAAASYENESHEGPQRTANGKRIPKMQETSSYSDEEINLKANLDEALRFG
ncbi:unnamed protein product [Chrysodeixis includens]|uniref:Uncharacterized protein n=1 Tax=Chrysodeixis includens TaxID=689277 RepID=A0A9N8KVG0_CHRIL|nr:unnamed protein product [Chrysodeixis includens]